MARLGWRPVFFVYAVPATFYLYAGLHWAVAVGVGPWLKETLRKVPQPVEPVVT
jgi:hypothetical protein